MFSTTAFPRSFSISIILSYEMKSPRSEKHSMSFLLRVYWKRCFNHFSEIRFWRCHVLYLSITFTFLTMICTIFSIWLLIDIFFFLRIVSAACFGTAMIHLSNNDNEIGKSNLEKLTSNFEFQCFSTWLWIIFAASKIVVKSSKLLFYVSMAFAWQSAELSCLDKRRVGSLENTNPGTVSFKYRL